MPDPSQDQDVQIPNRNAGRVPSLTARWVRYVVGFSVSVAVGLAPYLGKLRVPLFTPLLSLIPDSVQDIALPLSSTAMGIVAVLVQWYGSEKIGPRQLQRWFVATLVTCATALVLLTAFEMLCVVRVDVPAAQGVATFAIGLSHPHTPPCETLSRADCIGQKLSLNEAQIDTYFGETQANLSKLMLVLIYTLFMSCFGILVGLVLVRQAQSP